MNTLWAVDEVPFSSWILFILHLRPLTVSQCEQYKIFYKRGFISLMSIQQIKQRKKKVMRGGGGTCSPSWVHLLRLYCSARTQRREKENATKPKHRSSPNIHKGSTYGHLWQETIEAWKEEQDIYKQVRTLPTWLLWGSVQCRLGSGFWGSGGPGVGMSRQSGGGGGAARGWVGLGGGGGRNREGSRV